MAGFDTCCDYVLSHEGGLSEDKDDPGKITKFGISLEFLNDIDSNSLKKIGITGKVTRQTIIDLTIDQAKKLYYSEFWVTAPFEKVMNGIIAKYIFDMAVHHGLSDAVRITQRACCAAQKKYDYVRDDSLFGKNTLAAVNYASFMLIPALISERTGYMRLLVAVNHKLEPFLEGWLKRAFDI